MKKEMFYKYRAVNTKLIESLCWDKIFYASPASFNDPLDCKIFSIECDSSIEELRTIYARLKLPRTLRRAKNGIEDFNSKKSMLPLLEEMAKTIVINDFNNIHYRSTDPDYICSPEEAEAGILTSYINSELQEHYSKGVSCFSTDGKNMLMWSHYGDEHKGVCIGYSKDRRPIPDLKPVLYGKQNKIKTSSIYSAFVQNNETEKTMIESEILLRKHSAWRYEKEYRLLSNVGLEDSPLLLEEITFGLRCPYEIRHTIMRMLEGRTPCVRYYEMIKHHDKVNLTKIPYNENEEWVVRFPRIAVSGEEVFG